MGGMSQEGYDHELLVVVTSDGGCVPPVLFACFSHLDGSVPAPGPAERG